MSAPTRGKTFARCCATSIPRISTLPAVGVISPSIMRMVVVLPAPLGPRKPKISPRRTSTLRLSTASRSPYFFARLRVRKTISPDCGMPWCADATIV